MKVAYLLDSSSGVMENQSEDIYVLPLSIMVTKNCKVEQYLDDGKQFPLEKIFKLQKTATITTSQPSKAQIDAKISDLLKTYDLVIAIPISSGLSKCYETFCLLKAKYASKLLVLDCMNIQCGIPWLVDDLKAFIKSNPNFSFDDVIRINEANRKRNCGVIMVGDCKQLIRGGRLSAYKGFIVKLVGIKILIQLDVGIGGKLVYADKAFTPESAAQKSLELIDQKINFRQKGISRVAHLTTFLDPKKNDELYNIYKKKLEEYCGFKGEILRGEICSTVAIHTGIDTYTVYIKSNP